MSNIIPFPKKKKDQVDHEEVAYETIYTAIVIVDSIKKMSMEPFKSEDVIEVMSYLRDDLNNILNHNKVNGVNHA